MSIYDTLNKEQREAVEYTEGPLLLLAGAGSGKTRVLTHRICYLIEEMGVNPWNILAITFTNKAAGEMRERVDRLISFGGEQVWVATFHSTCLRILRRHIDRLGYNNHFTIYDTDDQKSVVKEICKRLNIDPKQMKEREIMGAISHAKDEGMSPLDYELQSTGDYRQKRIAAVYKEYQETLKKNNALDFDDLLVKTVELFKHCPDILEQYQNRFRYIMVDEYQDTNTIQFELIRLLAMKYRNLCVVGDDDQSIYKFRGANIRNILDYEKVFQDARVIKLEQNYRSTGTILNAANALVKNNVNRKDKALWTVKEDGNRIHLRQFENGYEEAEYVTDEIAKRVRREGAHYGECAVLYRTNAQSRLFEERMVMQGLPYRIVGGVNFYSRREIKDILAYLKTIANGSDDMAVKRIINIPKRGIGNTTIEKVDQFAMEKGISFFDALSQAEYIPSLARAASKIMDFVKTIQVLRAKEKEYGIEDIIREVIDTVKYEEYLESLDEEDTEDRLENINELLGKAVMYEKTHDELFLSEFLEEIALVSDLDSMEDAEDRILLMTLHSAKGLEFPYVYMVGMEDGLFPGYMAISSGDSDELEEERRLAYVGITRAMDDLTITYAKARMLRGEMQYAPISRFIREIPASLMDNTVPKSYSREKEPWDLPDPFSSFTEKSSSLKPKAALRPKITPADNKPFIAKGIDSLNRVAGLSKGLPQTAPQGLDYGVGDRVRHMKFGEGTVLNIVNEPRDYKVTVEFDNAGQKIMYASFAKLKRV